jgi:hypothetical protein
MSWTIPILPKSVNVFRVVGVFIGGLRREKQVNVLWTSGVPPAVAGSHLADAVYHPLRHTLRSPLG